jgi:hypothetical protein
MCSSFQHTSDLARQSKLFRQFLKDVQYFYADIWWQERVITYLDQMPSVWNSFPEMFAGGVVPFLAKVVDQTSRGLPRAIRLAITRQYEQDKSVKFRQIELEQNLARLFVDLDIDIRELQEGTQQKLVVAEFRRYQQLSGEESNGPAMKLERQLLHNTRSGSAVSALGVLLDDNEHTAIRKLILEGGPGQGKSTITQMAVQIYRQQILVKNDIDPEKRWLLPEKLRLPFRVELRRLAEWLSSNPDCSIERYLELMIEQDSGGNEISVDDIQTAVEKSPVLLIFDGLDEIGSDELRDNVLKAIMDCIDRFEDGLDTDLRVIVTTRPPALAGRRERLIDFERLSLAPMEKHRIEEYVTRWLSVQIHDNEEKTRIRESFQRRQDEPHVQALARNPMQLSVLLQFIRLKGEAFPDRRAELYRDYFQIVIDRDVEKSPELRKHREVIQALHEFIGYNIHALTEVNQADRTLERRRLLEMVKDWLKGRGHEPVMAQQFFKLGEERFGLIVASKGEGEETRYGYAIQPIQEYFAAAFISNQILPNRAHDVFEAMIHRPYWREVALFLAGLRRPNEKADLIARAKSVDQDKQWCWYQDGRAIVLQLLLEGVFSEPRYVFSQALEFVFDLLDTKKLRVQREPPGLLSALNTLTSRHLSEHHQERILELLQDYRTCEDQYVMMRLYQVASRLLSPDDYAKVVMSYKGSCPDLIALIRLGWPYSWEVDTKKLSQDPSFWRGVPDHTWAEIWWREAHRRGVALDLPTTPAHVHQHLVEQFATDPTSVFFYAPRRQLFIEAASRLAIWKMARYQQLIQMLAVCNILGETVYKTMQEELVSVCEDDLDVDCKGLDEPIRIMVTDIIQLSHALLVASCSDDEGKKSHALEEYIQGIREYLQYTGLAGWVACRCAANVIEGMIIGDVNSSRLGVLQSFAKREGMYSLAKDMRPFYEDPVTRDSDSSEDESEAPDFIVRAFATPYFFHPYRTESIPRRVRLEVGGRPVALVEILAGRIRHGHDLPFEWMRTMRFSTEVIHPLVEECRDCLPALLDVLGEYRFVRTRTKSLRVQDTQRVLKIARGTDDPKTLAGVATVLVSAGFLRIAEAALILKILRVDSNMLLASILFNTFTDEVLAGNPDRTSFTKEIGVIEEVARGILGKPEVYPFQTVCRAADFLAEHNRIELSPLLHDAGLGMRLQPL